ncbi:Uncharacterised protein [Candidatus Gugararchaeum adminiculabundum]|nr:Uncharacterised protein [Candidatus Gugararchaeum adminiculabundum]
MKNIQQKLYCRKCWGEIDETGSVCTMCGAENEAFEGVVDEEEFEKIEDNEKPVKMPAALDATDELTEEEESILEAKPATVAGMVAKEARDEWEEEEKKKGAANERHREIEKQAKEIESRESAVEAEEKIEEKGEAKEQPARPFFEEIRRVLTENGYMLSQHPCEFRFQNKIMNFSLVGIHKDSIVRNEPEIIIVEELTENQICTTAAVSKIEAKGAFFINSRELKQMIDEVREELGAVDNGFFGFFKKKTDYVNFLDCGQVEMVIITKNGFTDDAIETVRNSPLKFRLWHEKETGNAEEVNRKKE